MPKKPIRLIKQSSLALFLESDKLADFATEVLQGISNNLQASIRDAAGTSMERSVTVQAFISLQDEIEGHLAAAEKALEGFAYKTFTEGYQLQFESVLNQVKAFEQAASSGIPIEAIDKLSKLKPKINGNLIKATFEGSLENLTKSLSDVKEPLRRMISTNILTGGSYNDLVKDIKGNQLIKGPIEQVTYKARRIAITETTNVFNYARYDSVVAANRTLPDNNQLEFRWAALIDGSTSNRCKSLNGQVRKQGEDFVASDGWRGKMPAAHSHCRSEIVPFREAWAGILDELEEELKSQKE